MILSQTFTLISRLMGGDTITNQTLGGYRLNALFILANTVILFWALINTLIFELKNNISVLIMKCKVHEKKKEPKESGLVIQMNRHHSSKT